MTTNNIESILKEFHDKYTDLVWYARRSPEDLVGLPVDIRDKMLENLTRVSRTWAEEVEELGDPDEGDWHHGFNSGAMAAFRLFLGLLSEDPEEIEFSLDCFPDLDT
jgi:hypothetical protein